MSGKKVLLHSELPLPAAHSLWAAQTSSASRPQLLRAGTVSCGLSGYPYSPTGDLACSRDPAETVEPWRGTDVLAQ